MTTGSSELSDLAWPAVAAVAASAVLAIPLGSTEQHGPHLPLSTDSDVAVALCRRLAAARTDVVVAPAVAYGSSGEHAGFAGTLSIGQAALELLVLELVRSATDTFSRVLLVSAHGGNAEPVRRAVHRLTAEGRTVRLYEPRWPGDPHAGRVETALMLAVDPSVVRMDLAEPGDTRPLAETLPLLRRAGVRGVSPNGILGDPTGANAAEGDALFTRLTDQLVDTIADWPESTPATAR